MSATLGYSPLVEVLPVEPIIEDNWDIDDNGHGVGPELGCLNCRDDVRTQCGSDARAYRRFGIDGPWRTLDCPDCLDTIVAGFSL